MIDLKQIVVDRDGNKLTIVGIVLHDKDNKPNNLSFSAFVDSFTEYVDPKDIEIERLNKVIANLKLKGKKPRKVRRKLLPGELIEIKELIDKGEGNTAISKEYDCSDSTISRIRIEHMKGKPDGEQNQSDSPE